MSGDEKIVMPAPEMIDRAVKHIVEEGLGKGTAAGRKRRQMWLWALGGAAVIALVLTVGIPLFRKVTAKVNYPGVETVQAVKPVSSIKLSSEEDLHSYNKHTAWWNAQAKLTDPAYALQEGMRPYYERLMKVMLAGQEDNAVCSPLNIYMALAMLAEVTDGNTRQQILDVLCVPDVETLREKAALLWKSNYADSFQLQSLLADSYWLSSAYNYNKSTLQTLAERYYADSFIGTPGSDAMNKALQKWTDENTGGLLSEQTKEMKMDRNAVLALVSTILFKAMWEDPFWKTNNRQEVFHGAKGDTEVEMMHGEKTADWYEGECFESVGLPLTDSGFVYICLPKEGTEAADLAADPELLNMLKRNEQGPYEPRGKVILSLPKFKVEGQTDLMKILPALGITDVTDQTLADFTPLMAKKEEAAGLYLGKAQHAAMVEIDEDGIVGAAYTYLEMLAAYIEPGHSFTVDRPFLFLVTGQDNSILFAGVVQNIE
ncbi:MAG: serpin family protein [Lachnospiraceae bacterium]|nr:serpin family protein [Lachnospiraceae bacterium]